MRNNIISLLLGNGDSLGAGRFIAARRDNNSQAGPRTEQQVPTHSCFSAIVLSATQQRAVGGYDDMFRKCWRSWAHSSSLSVVQKTDLHTVIFGK